VLHVNEIFGPTIQGEGFGAGRHCVFARLANCNLECKWCDTPYTWAYSDMKASKHETAKAFDKHDEVTTMEADEIYNTIHDLWDISKHPTMVVISGGEPLMQQGGLVPLARTLHITGNNVHIETAGTLRPGDELDENVAQYNVSPKLANSGNIKTKRYKPKVLDWFAGYDKAYFKFVMRSRDDFKEVDEIVQTHQISPNRVMVMPEATYGDRVVLGAKMLAHEAVQRGYGVSLRSHIVIWENARRR
jgi:7-carboxy-7-deazaguanine synthase